MAILCVNTTTHLHQDMDGSSAMCSLSMSACPINHLFEIVPDIAHSHTYYNQYNHTPQSHDYPTCVESLPISNTVITMNIKITHTVMSSLTINMS